jgi:hypothetical protein
MPAVAHVKSIDIGGEAAGKVSVEARAQYP